MKFLHVADLHIGKVVNGFSMLADQEEILKQIRELALREQVQALVIAGDVYDRPIPPAEAVELLDGFLTGLAEAGICVLLAAGNHDSGVRLGFAGQILEKRGLIMGGSVSSPLKKVVFRDEYGEAAFFLMPFFKPAALKPLLGVTPEDTQEGVRLLLEREKAEGRLDANGRNVLITHFFVTNRGALPEQSDSETAVSVGGIDAVEAELFQVFDYTALGHIHKPQKIGERPVYYAGSPLKYSFSEVHHEKAALLVELKEKGNVSVRSLSLKPLRDMRKIQGKLSELLKEETFSLADREDYICAVLTDEEELFDPIGSLRRVYPNVMQLILQKNRQDAPEHAACLPRREKKNLLELYRDFFVQAAGRELTGERESVIREALAEAGGEEG